MRMCKKRTLSLILTLALIVGCFAGTGITVKAADNTLMQVKVVNETGNLVGNVAFEVQKNTDSSKIKDIVSDGEGILKYSVRDGNPGTYKIALPSSSNYSSTPESIKFKVGINNTIEKINDIVWTGNEDLNFVIKEKSGEEAPTVDKTSITIKLVDSEGNLVTDAALRLGIIDTQFPNQETSKTPINGVFTYKITDNIPTTYTIKIHSSVTSYTAAPIEIVTNNKKEIVTVNKEAYEGRPVQMVVTKQEGGSVNKTELNTLIMTAKAKKADDYVVDANWTAMQQRLTEAEDVYKNSDATAEQVQNAVNNLRAALAALVPIEKPVEVDRTELGKRIADAESRNEQDYVADGKWAAMQVKLQAAKTVYEDKDATVAQITIAVNELNVALNALVLKTVIVSEVTVTPKELSANGGTINLNYSQYNSISR